MREILFRGKRKDNGDWAYGYIVIKPYGSFIEKVELNCCPKKNNTLMAQGIRKKNEPKEKRQEKYLIIM